MQQLEYRSLLLQGHFSLFLPNWHFSIVRKLPKAPLCVIRSSIFCFSSGYVPKIYSNQYVLAGLTFSEKSGIYLLAAQLFFSDGLSSIAAAVIALIFGFLYSQNNLGLQRFRLPKFIEVRKIYFLPTFHVLSSFSPRFSSRLSALFLLHFLHCCPAPTLVWLPTGNICVKEHSQHREEDKILHLLLNGHGCSRNRMPLCDCNRVVDCLVIMIKVFRCPHPMKNQSLL